MTLLTPLLAVAAHGAPRAALFDELTPLFPDSHPADGAAELHSDTPRGVPVGIHVLVAGLEPNAPVRCTLQQGEQTVNAHVYQLRDVPVEQNVGLTGFTECSGGENPHVIRDAPFRVFEPLLPIEDQATASPAGVVALRIELDITPDFPAEQHAYTLALTSGTWRQTLTWRIHVWPVRVPPPSPQSPGYTNWFSLFHIEDRHGVKRWSEPFWRVLAQHADLMQRGRQNTFYVPWDEFITREGASFSVAQARLKRYIDLFIQRGFCRLEGGHLARRHAGDWKSPRLDLIITGDDIASPKGAAALAELVGAIRTAVAALDLPDDVAYLQHLADEPTDTNAAAYRTLAAAVRESWPDVARFDAAMSEQVAGSLDVWCVHTQHFEQYERALRERQDIGEGVWIYTCTWPGGPYLNRLLDQERVRCVYLHWALVAERLDGLLHWGLNFYRAGLDPYEHSVVPHVDPNTFLPAGDPHVLYPTPDGPITGQRFEAHRIGAEDAELLRMMWQRDPAQTRRLILRVYRSMSDWEPDVANYRAARRELLRSLSQPADQITDPP